jgi:hypothetical protein
MTVEGSGLVGRILDWHKAAFKKDYGPEEEGTYSSSPVLCLESSIYLIRSSCAALSTSSADS